MRIDHALHPEHVASADACRHAAPRFSPPINRGLARYDQSHLPGRFVKGKNPPPRRAANGFNSCMNSACTSAEPRSSGFPGPNLDRRLVGLKLRSVVPTPPEALPRWRSVRMPAQTERQNSQVSRAVRQSEPQSPDRRRLSPVGRVAQRVLQRQSHAS